MVNRASRLCERMADFFRWFWDRSKWLRLPGLTPVGSDQDFAVEPTAWTIEQTAEFGSTNSSERMQSTSNRSVPRSWLYAFYLLIFVYFVTCGFPRLFDQIDGQYAGAAREMMMSGNWLTPMQNGVPRLQKPPLVYWCEIGSMSLFGVNEFGARFPVIVATMGWFLATGLLARRIVGTRRAAMAASLVLSMFMGSYVFNHLVMPEPFLGCFLALSFWCLVSALQAGRKEPIYADRWLMAAWFFISLGALAKGLHALIFPIAGTIISAWLRPETRGVWWRFLCRPHGWVLFLLLFLPWYLYTESQFPGFLKDHFFNEQLGSIVRRRWPPDSNHVSLSVFWLQHVGLFFPITLMFPVAIAATWNACQEKRGWLQGEWHLLLFWFLLNSIGISFANIQDYYLMTAWPVVAVWIAWTVTSQHGGPSFRFVGAGLAIFAALGLAVALCLVVQQHPDQVRVVTEGRPGRDNTILEALRGFPRGVWVDLLPLIGIGCGGALITGFFLFFYCQRKYSDLGLAALGVFMSGLFLLSARGFIIVQDGFSSIGVAKLIETHAGPNAMVISQGDSNENTSLFFYLNSPIFWVDGNPEIEFATRIFGIGRDHYLSRAQVAKAWNEPTQVFLIVESSGLDQWKGLLSLDSIETLGNYGSRVVLTNHTSLLYPAR